MKVIKPLFLDDLTKEFETINSRKDNHRIKELERFQLAEQRRERRMLQNKVDAMIKSKES